MTVNLVERKTEIHKVTVTFEVDLHGTEIDIREVRNVLNYIFDISNDTIIGNCLGSIIAQHMDDDQNQVCMTVSTSSVNREVL